MPKAMPISATPIVPAVVQELPITSGTSAHSRPLARWRIEGSRTASPYRIRIGTLPERIHAPIGAPTAGRMKMAEAPGASPCDIADWTSPQE
jgi:hypothetical protein